MWSVKNIHKPESKSIEINFRLDTRNFLLEPFMVTMDGHLLVIGRDLGQVLMMSFAEEAMSDNSPSGKRIELPPGRAITRMESSSAHGVLKNEENDQSTLIVAGNAEMQGGGLQELYCESYEINKGWTECKLPPYDFRDSIVWKNRLVGIAYIRTKFAVYSPKENKWSTRVAPGPSPLITPRFFLNVHDHLCLNGRVLNEDIRNWQVWCLSDFESNWEIMPDWYVIPVYQMKLIGTLPANVISTLVTTNTGH